MKAKHEPSGDIVDAKNVGPGDLRKSGPWVCDEQTCDLRYTGHRLSTWRKRGDTRHAVGATFTHAKTTSHAPGCRHNAGETKARLQAKHPDTLGREGNFLQLSIGARPVKGTGDKAAPRTSTLNRQRAAAVLASARDVAREIDKHGDDEEVMRGYRVRHHGADYTWREFSFGHLRTSLDRLLPAIERSFILNDRPWFVRGVAAWRAEAAESNEEGQAPKWRIRLKNSEATGETVSVYASAGSAAEAVLRRIGRDDRIAVLALSAGVLRTGRAWVLVTDAEQVHVAPASTRSMDGSDAANKS